MTLSIRGSDSQGSGLYRASRGSRLHNGIDICCKAHVDVLAVSAGEVTKIGFPYGQRSKKQLHGDDLKKFEAKKALRYVQVTDAYGIDCRYFYVSPTVKKGDMIRPSDIIGRAQGLAHIYKGITEHYHFETLIMVMGQKVFLDPNQYLFANSIQIEATG